MMGIFKFLKQSFLHFIMALCMYQCKANLDTFVYKLFPGWEVCIVENWNQGPGIMVLKSSILKPRSQFFTSSDWPLNYFDL